MKNNGSPFIVLLVLLLCSNFLWPQSIYEKSSRTDIPIMFGAVGGLGFGNYLSKNLKPLTPEELGILRQQNVLFFDRWACKIFSPKADDLSDVFLGVSVLSPLLMLASTSMDKDQKWTHVLMYLETEILTLGVTEITKNITKRIRPYAYNPDVPLEEKVFSTGTRKSFFSGHTSMSFASVVFLAQTYASIHPDSRWRPWIWGAGLSAATLVGVLRILSGRHFPSDVLVGALVGSFIGILIPKLHETKPLSSGGPHRAFQVSFQLSF